VKNPIFWLSLFCAAAFLWQLFQLFSGFKSQSWPATLAVIKRVSMEERDQGDGDIAYDVNVEYTYRVDGKDYVSGRLTYAVSTQLSHEEASVLTNRLSLGSETKAYYNPTQPAIAVLRKGVDRSSLDKTAIFGALTMVCTIITIYIT
jgi:Protein of unknown function (DUF3592)